MTSQGTAHGRFERSIRNRNLLNGEIAAREIGELSLVDALAFRLLLADVDPPRAAFGSTTSGDSQRVEKQNPTCAALTENVARHFLERSRRLRSAQTRELRRATGHHKEVMAHKRA